MRTAILLLLSFAAPLFGQDTPPPAAPAAPPATVSSLASALQPTVRQRAMQFYRMPDGTIWDGWYAAEYRRLITRSIKGYDRIQRAQPTPGQAIVEDRTIGVTWKINKNPEVAAWRLVESLANDNGELSGLAHDLPLGPDNKPLLEVADRHRWTDAPPLWSSLQARDYSWPFAFIDENEPDDYTRKVHKGYLRVTRSWGDDRYEFEGYSLDLGPVSGVVIVPDSRRFIRDKDRFKGVFFLWPAGETDQPGGKSRALWQLIPADELRLSPDDLADALVQGKAEISLWTHERTRDNYLWKHATRDVELAAAPPLKREPKPAPPPIEGGPDLLILKDGRWFRGKILRKDDKEVVILTPVGQMQTEMKFAPDEVKEVQTPEHR